MLFYNAQIQHLFLLVSYEGDHMSKSVSNFTILKELPFRNGKKMSAGTTPL